MHVPGLTLAAIMFLILTDPNSVLCSLTSSKDHSCFDQKVFHRARSIHVWHQDSIHPYTPCNRNYAAAGSYIDNIGLIIIK